MSRHWIDALNACVCYLFASYWEYLLGQWCVLIDWLIDFKVIALLVRLRRYIFIPILMFCRHWQCCFITCDMLWAWSICISVPQTAMSVLVFFFTWRLIVCVVEVDWLRETRLHMLTESTSDVLLVTGRKSHVVSHLDSERNVLVVSF